jgi:hypothetical protein
MTILRRILFIAAAALLSLVASPGPAPAGEEATIQAFSALQGQGQIVQTSPDGATYVGILSGRFYIDNGKGPIDSGNMVCPAMVRVNLKDGTEVGSGDCAVTGEHGFKVFMVLACKGVHLVGCAGESTLTGGTGRFANVSGGGHFVIRSRLEDIILSDFTAKETATGVIFWRELHYKIP